MEMDQNTKRTHSTIDQLATASSSKHPAINDILNVEAIDSDSHSDGHSDHSDHTDTA